MLVMLLAACNNDDDALTKNPSDSCPPQPRPVNKPLDALQTENLFFLEGSAAIDHQLLSIRKRRLHLENKCLKRYRGW